MPDNGQWMYNAGQAATQAVQSIQPAGSILGSMLGAVPLVGNVLGTILNNHYQKQANNQMINFQWDMYKTQRADALADWQRNAQYNSPAEQMARYKAAGLNPNLIYGQSNMSQPVRSSSSSSVSLSPSRVDPNMIGNAILQTQNIIRTKQENENLKANQQLINAEALLTKIKALNEATTNPELTKSQTEKNRWDVKQGQGLFSTTLEGMAENIKKMTAEISSMLDENKRRNLAFPLEQAKRKLENIEIQLRNAKTKEETKNLIQQRDKVVEEINNIKSQTAKNKVEISIDEEKLLQEKMETFLRNNGTSFHDQSILRNFINWFSGGGGKDFLQ